MRIIFKILLLFSIISQAQEIDSTWMNINNLRIPVHNDGNIGLCSGSSQAEFDEIVFMCSSGFYICGYSGDSLWATGVLASNAHHNGDFLPGNVEKVNDDSLYMFYSLRSSDEDFGSSWQNWRNAVNQGAKFYDGNNDGVYNPVDLNENGVWDEDEDKPDLLGDQTVWSVFTDSYAEGESLLNEGPPIGLEIKQTIFGLNQETSNELKNVIFVRYIINNSGLLNDRLDSVYFAPVVDADIGDYVDDLPGCDSVREVSYAYNQGSDELYGDNPPCLMLDLLQGPQSFIPGVTFIDNNGDGYFEQGIDTPLDSADVHNGELLGKKVVLGARNEKMKSNSPMDRVWMALPEDKYEVKNLLFGGLNTYGETIDPCSDYWSKNSSIENCEHENSMFPFSGDPITKEGWIRHQWQGDVYFLTSTGPFYLMKDDQVEIWLAYIVGRGIDSLNSITVAREIDDFVQEYYESNFDLTKVSVELKRAEKISTNYRLNQNYPNPFNPITTITYQIPNDGYVNLVVYNSLGQVVEKLVNKNQTIGKYSVEFNATNLSSGVYFYRIQVDDYVSVKKILLMK